jgi:hypothetical protein
VGQMTCPRVGARDRLQAARRLDRQLHLDREHFPVSAQERKIGTVKRPPPAGQFADDRRGDRPLLVGL